MTCRETSKVSLTSNWEAVLFSQPNFRLACGLTCASCTGCFSCDSIGLRPKVLTEKKASLYFPKAHGWIFQ
ncbi:uncharacterized protein LOC143244468 isoform X2 [Tachypleus tridentatus]|uniref:uncharacterized protein LOC143244468 isoform X2 n=1 Tax=Tachypleus tridentatus TaxID=6853 RepID=UPI003FD3FB09